MSILFIVDATPRGKGRPRVLKNGRTYTPATTKEHEEIIREAFLRQCPDTAYMDGEALELNVDIRMPIPKSYTKRQQQDALDGRILPAKKPDVDNILKAICDALNGVAYKDDAQITRITADKTYGLRPGYLITINEIDD